MEGEHKTDTEECPVVAAEREARRVFEDVLEFCCQDAGSFRSFETNLLRRLFVLGCLLEPLFPQAIFTLDVCHAVEYLWDLGHRFHKEGSEELKAQVGEWKELV